MSATSPRVWGRQYAADGSYQWVAITPDANGSLSPVNMTWLVQVVLLNLGESPIFSDWGIPAQQSVVTQILPDFYMHRIQQQFSPYFANLQISKQSGAPNPVYNASVITFEGTVFPMEIAT